MRHRSPQPGWTLATGDARPAAAQGRVSARSVARGRRRARVLLTAVAALAVLLAGPSGPATAHDALVSSDPADGAVLTAAPAQVVLTFTSDQLDVGAVVEVVGLDGVSWSDGDVVVSGPTVTQTLLPGMPGGGYQLRWRSVSADGHPITGMSEFTIDVPVETSTLGPEPTEPAEPEATAEPEALAEGDPTTPGAITPAPQVAVQARDGAAGGPTNADVASPVGLWLGLGLAGLAGAVLVAILRRGRATR